MWNVDQLWGCVLLFSSCAICYQLYNLVLVTSKIIKILKTLAEHNGNTTINITKHFLCIFYLIFIQL